MLWKPWLCVQFNFIYFWLPLKNCGCYHSTNNWKPINRYRPIIGRLFGADNRPADNRPKRYRYTSKILNCVHAEVLQHYTARLIYSSGSACFPLSSRHCTAVSLCWTRSSCWWWISTVASICKHRGACHSASESLDDWWPRVSDCGVPCCLLLNRYLFISSLSRQPSRLRTSLFLSHDLEVSRKIRLSSPSSSSSGSPPNPLPSKQSFYDRTWQNKSLICSFSSRETFLHYYIDFAPPVWS